MAATLPYELAKFNKNCKYLRKILKNTQIALEEIRVSGKFYADHLASADFTSEEIHIINRVIEQPPCFIVFGQNSYSKACVVNELFCQPILPLISESQKKCNWRTVCFQYGVCNQISLMLPDSYELAQPLAAHESPWQTIPLEDLEIKENLKHDEAHISATLEVNTRYVLLKDDVKIVVTPSEFFNGIEEFVDKYTTDVVPIVIYAIAEETFSEEDLSELQHLKDLVPKSPVFFIRTPPLPSEELTESEQHTQLKLMENRSDARPTRLQSNGPQAKISFVLFQSLCNIGFLTILPNNHQINTLRNIRRNSSEIQFESEFVESFESFADVVLFVRHTLNCRIITATEILRDGHSRCLRMFILSAFDMTRDMIITPRRLEYAKVKETELFNTLTDIADHKQDEIKDLIVESIANMKEELLEKAAAYEFTGVKVSENGEIKSSRELKLCTGEIQDLILVKLNHAVASKLIKSGEYLKESYVGTLQRCLHSLENAALEEGESPQASIALKRILDAAYRIEITTKTSSSFMQVLWEKMKQLVQNMPWKTTPRIDSEWKKKIATDMMSRLNEARLSRSICSQFREKLKQSHDTFSVSLRQLQEHHSGRLERTEERRLKVRKELAPKLALYALESTSLQDMLLYGMPQLGREIGRGQYGVVYSCKSWGGYSPCALKSVVPPDDKHWNDLAMEFYYTRSVPEHDHVVAIRGSVIDHSHGGGSSPAVLLIMDELQRDLHTAIKTGLDWLGRLQVAIDVVQGIRFLHSQGLIHRDIKLKNVLLDKKNRGKVTDLGFCKPEAMMSGSIVGTPIHMAPELFSGRYDNTVDIYAFGILFWYICAGHVRLPYVYEQCQNKDYLWNAVRRGCRPERLPQFDETCWTLMEECWAGDVIVRPLLGDVENRLRMIREHYRDIPPPGTEFLQREVGFGFLSASAYIDVDYCPPI